MATPLATVEVGATDLIWATVTDAAGSDLSAYTPQVADTITGAPLESDWRTPDQVTHPTTSSVRVGRLVTGATVGVHQLWVRLLGAPGTPVINAGQYLVVDTAGALTTVRVQLQTFTLGGAAGIAGRWSWRPSRRVRTSSRIVLPTPLTFTTSDAEAATGAFLLALAPTDLSDYLEPWCWTVTEPGGHVRNVVVPTSATVLDYASLAEVDPASYAVTAPPPWFVQFARDQARRVAAMEATTFVESTAHPGLWVLTTTPVADPIPNTDAGITAYVNGYVNGTAGGYI